MQDRRAARLTVRRDLWTRLLRVRGELGPTPVLVSIVHPGSPVAGGRGDAGGHEVDFGHGYHSLGLGVA